MHNFDERLQQLRQQCARAGQLRAKEQELLSQHQTLSRRADKLKAAMQKEQADVDRLEGRSLAAFFYQVVGKKEGKLDKEKQEAYAARVKYDAAARELEGAEADLRRVRGELAELAGCEETYRAALEEKASALKAAGGAGAERVLALEEDIVRLDSQLLELSEAIAAGKIALNTTDRVLSQLDSAEGWGTWDLVGGGLLTDMVKYEHLDAAQSELELLQEHLRRFKTELADVRLQADLQVGVDDFLRFADCFFDNLFTDWTVLEQINQSQQQVRGTRGTIEHTLLRLQDLMSHTRQEREQLRMELDELLLRAEL